MKSEPGVHGGVSGDEAVDACEPEEAADRVHHRGYRGTPESGLAELTDVQLDMGALYVDQRAAGPQSVVIAMDQIESACDSFGKIWVISTPKAAAPSV